MKISQSDIICERIDSDLYYYIGYCKLDGNKILSVTITWIMWYEVVFKISQEEYNWWYTDKEKLNNLASQIAHDKGRYHFSDRLLYDGGPSQ